MCGLGGGADGGRWFTSWHQSFCALLSPGQFQIILLGLGFCEIAGLGFGVWLQSCFFCWFGDPKSWPLEGFSSDVAIIVVWRSGLFFFSTLPKEHKT